MSLLGYTESVASILVKNALAVLATYFALVGDFAMAGVSAVGAFYLIQWRMLWLLELDKIDRDFNK